MLGARRRPRGALLWTTGTTRNTECDIKISGLVLLRHGGVLLLRPLVDFYSGVDTRELAQRRFDWSEIGGDLEALYRSVSEPLAKAA